MDARTLQDRMTKGLGVAARKLGEPFTVFRPAGPLQPTAPQNRVIVLFAAFRAEGGGTGRAPDYGQPLWWGTFDASYTRPGDYLVCGPQVYFVASQIPGLPVQCVRTNRVVTILRPAPTASGGYNGFYATPGDIVIDGWPASLLEAGGRAGDAKPNEMRFGAWTLLLPALPAPPQVADVVTDDFCSTYVVTAAEQSELGWRLLVRQIGA
jgi:hypothetical protein